jgi:nitrate reductase gamma subunit
MSALSVVYAILLYGAFIFMLVGLGLRILKYIKTPAPLKIPTTPAPTTRAGVGVRLFKEVVFFESLFKSNKWIWIFGFMFHFSLLLAFFRHLRYAMDPSNPLWPIISFNLLQLAGAYAGWTMLIGLLGLLARRIFVDRVRYISSPSDYLMLLLIIAIAVTGLMTTFVDHIHVAQFKGYVHGLVTFSYGTNLPAHTLILTHLALVALLMIIFPISKLLHAPGVFFSPTRNQVDNAREKRHLAAWAAPLDQTRGSK